MVSAWYVSCNRVWVLKPLSISSSTVFVLGSKCPATSRLLLSLRFFLTSIFTPSNLPDSLRAIVFIILFLDVLAKVLIVSSMFPLPIASLSSALFIGSAFEATALARRSYPSMSVVRSPIIWREASLSINAASRVRLAVVGSAASRILDKLLSVKSSDSFSSCRYCSAASSSVSRSLAYSSNTLVSSSVRAFTFLPWLTVLRILPTAISSLRNWTILSFAAWFLAAASNLASVNALFFLPSPLDS